jgi:hypothetical protein
MFSLLLVGYVFGMEDDSSVRSMLNAFLSEYDGFNETMQAVREDLWARKDPATRAKLESIAKKQDLSFEGFLKIRKAAPAVLAQAKRDGLIS